MSKKKVSDLQLSIQPEDALVDVSRKILVSGLQPGARVSISTRTKRADNNVWQSSAVFQADANGCVDTAVQPALDGSYTGVSAMGLIWSQMPVKDTAGVYPDNLLKPLVTEVLAKSEQQTVSANLVQRFTNPGVVRQEINDNGLVGTLYRPAGSGPHPAIMILNGSGGGMNEPRAALYAAHGYMAFALGYFGAPDLPNYISNINLEYFKQGLDWIRQNLQPANNFVALNGQSRGGELVLLLASMYPADVSAVVAYVPGAVVHGGQNAADPAVGRDGPAWLLDGKPVPHIWQNNKTASWAAFDAGERHTVSIMTALQDTEAVARARIPVEKIQAPVILLSAGDDAAWPSSLYSKMVLDSLRTNNYPYEYDWVDTPAGGHSIVFPYLPTIEISRTHPVSGHVYSGGGSPEPNAISNEKTWLRIKLFLNRAVALQAVKTKSLKS